ncbi:MAG: type II toxin-antitoxin system RelE/ParE family toxin [bacterium]|nr:type II toxin-antitoxin system RelE/ParE family toxin [bacterium]
MSADTFFIPRRVEKTFSRLPLRIRHHINQAFEHIRMNPLYGKKLLGPLQEYRKVRVGDYRIIYSFDGRKHSVTVLKIEHRQGVYR